MTRKRLTTGLLVALFAMNGLGLLGWAHAHGAPDGKSHQADDCTICLALSAKTQDRAVVETPHFWPPRNPVLTANPESPLVPNHTPIATLYRRGPPPCP